MFLRCVNLKLTLCCLQLLHKYFCSFKIKPLERKKLKYDTNNEQKLDKIINNIGVEVVLSISQSGCEFAGGGGIEGSLKFVKTQQIASLFLSRFSVNFTYLNLIKSKINQSEEWLKKDSVQIQMPVQSVSETKHRWSVKNAAFFSSISLSKLLDQFSSFQAPRLAHRQLEELKAQRLLGDLLDQCGTSFEDQFICKNLRTVWCCALKVGKANKWTQFSPQNWIKIVK